MTFDVNSLSDELKAKVSACKSAEELMALAKSEGVELSDEQLEAINGSGPEDWLPSTPVCKFNSF